MTSKTQQIWGTGVATPLSKREKLAIQKEQQENRDIRKKHEQELQSMQALKPVKHDFKKLCEARDIATERQRDKDLEAEFEL